MKKAPLIYGLIVVALILSNTFSILTTYYLTSNKFKDNEGLKPAIMSPIDTTTIAPTQVESTQAISPIPVEDIITLVNTGETGKTYHFYNYSIEIPETYNISVDDNDGRSIIIKPKIQKNLANYNNLMLRPHDLPFYFDYTNAWEPSLDSELTINNTKYHKIASVFCEGSETRNGLIEWIEGNIDYYIFHDSFVIIESIGGNAEDYPISEGSSNAFRDMILNSEGQALVTEMDKILNTLKYID